MKGVDFTYDIVCASFRVVNCDSFNTFFLATIKSF